MSLKISTPTMLYFIMGGYHPPKPKYDASEFLHELVTGIDVITQHHPSSIILIAGNFNQLDTSIIEVDYRLTQIVTTPTHNQNLNDKVFTNRPDLYDAHCFKSLVKTKHLAVLITALGDQAAAVDIRQSRRYYVNSYDLHSHNLDKLRYALGTFDWSHFLSISDVTLLYDSFFSIVLILSHTQFLNGVLE